MGESKHQKNRQLEINLVLMFGLVFYLQRHLSHPFTSFRHLYLLGRPSLSVKLEFQMKKQLVLKLVFRFR